MFGGASTNPYDDIVVKTTDENLTSENWELILNLCDKVQDEGSEGAHNVVAALLKRLTHRNPNVQLYTLSLAEALSKNCSIELHRELASRAWTAGLERVITDRNTHDKVRTRALGLVAQWTAEFADDSTLGIMGECYEGLKAKKEREEVEAERKIEESQRRTRHKAKRGLAWVLAYLSPASTVLYVLPCRSPPDYKYTRPDTPPPPAVDDAIRRREEEELQRVLEMSVRDRGGRQPYAFELSDDAGAGAGSSSAAAGASSATTTTYGNANGAGAGSSYGGASSSGGTYAGGYTPAAAQTRERSPSPGPGPQSPGAGGDASSIPDGAIVTRVRALHPFTPTEAGELGFEKGDVIKVVDRGYRDWWRGQLRGRTGIFPVNYVEPLPEPTPAELAAEATQEAAVFAQAVNVERLLNMLRALDPSKGDNLADDEEIQELYRSCMALRPKIVKLIDKYSQKRADLVSMNETFVRARTIFDRMMEESLARHSGGAVPAPYYPQPQAYGAATGGAWGGYPDAAAYAYAQAQAAQQGQQQQQGQGQQPAAGQAGYGVYGPQGPTPYPAQQQQPQQAQAQQGPTPYPAQQQPAQAQTPYQQPQQQAQGPTPYPAQQQQQQQQPQQAATPYQQPTQQAQPQAAAQQQQAQPVQQQPAAQAQPEPQQQAQPEPQPQQQQQPAQQAGPPYIYDPHTTYADPNVQAWAQYYAAGGKDLAGSVYFVSIPGLTDSAPAPAPAPAAATQVAEQQQQQQQQAQQAAVAQQQAQAQVAQQQQQQQQPQHQNSLPTSPIDDDPGYFPDPYANQLPDPYANQPQQQGYQQPAAAQQQQQDYAQAYHQQTPSTVTSPGGSGSELAHALGPTQAQAQQYQGYSLTDPGSGSAQQQQPRQGYSLTDPGSGSAGAAPSSPVSSQGHGGGAAAYGAPAGAAEPAVVAASTPSWVLPKKSPNPNARGAGSPQPGAALTGQFAGMHV